LKLIEKLSERSKPFIAATSIATAAILWVIDTVTGSEISFSIFYLIPISMMAWLSGRRMAIILSLICAALWGAADVMGGQIYSHPLIIVWNATVRLGFFMVVSHTLAALKTAQERREELVHCIVHDLRSPLSNVIMGIQSIQGTAGEALGKAQKEYLDICAASSDRMLTLINSMLDAASLESGKMPIQPTEFSVREVVEESVRQVSLWAGRGKVGIKYEVEPEALTAFADRDLTTRVIINLLSNAIKFSKRDTMITVCAAQSEDNMVIVSVIDQGYGIPEEWVDKVFDKFVQVDARRAGSSVGSGLGLAFCRKAVEAQGGSISLQSEVNKGTSITFRLPRQSRNTNG